MTTMSDMVAEVRRLTYGTLTEQLNLIKTDYAAGQTEIFLDMDTTQIQPGAILSAGLNVWYVRSVSSGSRSVLVIPGYDNAPQQAGSAGEFVYVRPRMTNWQAFSQLNHQFSILSSPSVGMYPLSYWETDIDTTYQTYPFPAGANVEGIVQVLYRLPGTPDVWYEMDNNSYRVYDGKVQLMQNVPTGGARLKFTYRTLYTKATNLTDDVKTVVGLAETAHDIPPLGVAIGLLRTTESRRNQIQTQTDARRADEVAATANNTDAGRLERVYQRRVNEEYSRLISKNPITMGI